MTLTRESSGQKITLKQLRGTSPTLTTSCGQRMKQSSTWIRHINRHNAVIRSVQNPHAFMECSNQKKAGVMVWAGLIKDFIIGPFFIKWKCHRASVPSATKAEGVASPASYHGEEEEFVVFQHDGASAHYETRGRAWLDGKLEDRWMGRGGPIPWPARSPDLSPLDFWLWGYLSVCKCGDNIGRTKTGNY